MAGVDKNDATTVKSPLPLFVKGGIKGLTIGLPKEYFVDGTDKGVTQAVEKAIEDFKKLGVKFKSVSLPHTKYVVPVYYIITPSEVSSNLGRFDGIKYGLSASPQPSSSKGEGVSDLMSIYTKSRGQGFGSEAKRRIMLGTYALSAGYFDAYYLKAQKVRALIREDFDKAFEKVDVIVGPTSPTTAFKIGEKSDDPLAMYLSDIYTVPVNLAGVPAISVPCGLGEQSDLPVGFQLIGRMFDESTILRAAWHIEDALTTNR